MLFERLCAFAKNCQKTMQIFKLTNENHKDFHKKFIAKRQPCIIEAKELFDRVTAFKDQLMSLDSEIKVEVLSNGQFGVGNQTQTNFQSFLKDAKSGKLYLTTQYEDSGDDFDIITRLLAPPLDELANLLVLDLPFAQHLILQQMNLWMGGGLKQSSSGLHHDFHDNFYFLMHGEKKFTIFPPEQFPNLYLYGSVAKMHENGLITYNEKGSTNGKETIRSDGAYWADVAEWKMEKAEQGMEAAEEGTKEFEDAEKDLNEALELVMHYPRGEEEMFDDELVDGLLGDISGDLSQLSACESGTISEFGSISIVTVADLDPAGSACTGSVGAADGGGADLGLAGLGPFCNSLTADKTFPFKISEYPRKIHSLRLTKRALR